MGWLIYSHTPASIRDEIARLCTWGNDAGRAYPVHICQKGTVWYAAVRSEPAGGRKETGKDSTGSYETDATGSYTFAAVFLTTRQDGGWGYKDMDETAGPREARAPIKLIDMLSPTTSEWAQKWRQKCRDNAVRTSRTLKPGDVIRLEEPLRFTDGSERQTFRVSVVRPTGALRNRTIFICIETGAACRISNIRQRNWTRTDALDALNDRFGKKTVVLGREGFTRSWTKRAELRSPRYTTRISDLPTVQV